MRNTFLPNRTFQCQSCQSHTGLKFFPKRENRALFMKIVQNALFRSCAARFGQIAFVSVKVFKIVTLVSKSLQKGKTVRFSYKLYKTLLSGHAQHVLAKSHFWASKFSKASHWPQILFKTGKQCAFHENWQNALFRSCAARFGQIAFLSVKVVKIVTLALNSLQKRENSAHVMKIVQNALFRLCAARFGQIAFLSVKSLKIVTLAWNFLQNGKNCALFIKIVQTFFSGHAHHVFAKSHFWALKFSKASHWRQIHSKKGKQCAFHENCTKRFF